MFFDFCIFDSAFFRFFYVHFRFAREAQFVISPAHGIRKSGGIGPHIECPLAQRQRTRKVFSEAGKNIAESVQSGGTVRIQLKGFFVIFYGFGSFFFTPFNLGKGRIHLSAFITAGYELLKFKIGQTAAPRKTVYNGKGKPALIYALRYGAAGNHLLKV